MGKSSIKYYELRLTVVSSSRSTVTIFVNAAPSPGVYPENDEAILGVARLKGFEEDLRLTGSQYRTITSSAIFFVGYFLMQIPSFVQVFFCVMYVIIYYFPRICFQPDRKAIVISPYPWGMISTLTGG